MSTDLLLAELERTLQTLQPLAAKSSQGLAAQQMRQRIDMGLWPPGHALPSERALADQLGVGRQTVREAVRTLMAEGRVRPGRARSSPEVAASQFDLTQERRRLRAREAEFRDLLSFRRLIEVRAAELAASERRQEHLALMAKAQGGIRTALAVNRADLFRAADTSFHMAVAAASGSRSICDHIRTCRAAMFPALDVLIVGTGHLADSMQEHEYILDSIGARSVADAGKMMDGHLEQTEVRLAEMLSQRTAVGPL